MLHVTQEDLTNFEPKHPFFVGIDSDGCVFDSMELKHKECFCPQFINHFDLQAVSKYAREVWDFVNLYSKTRGLNRFLAVVRALDLISERKEVLDRNVHPVKLASLKDWIDRETKLGNPALEKEAEKTSNPELKQAFNWSTDVNDTVKKIVRNVPPFPLVQQSLQKLQGSADVIVVSQTPTEALEREWKENTIDQYVQLICGQEQGTKTEHIGLTAADKYETDHVLMIGDAPGDLKAAKTNNALFFPINPGAEEASWECFYGEAIDKFINGSFAGAYEANLIEKFESCLPENPLWLVSKKI